MKKVSIGLLVTGILLLAAGLTCHILLMTDVWKTTLGTVIFFSAFGAEIIGTFLIGLSLNPKAGEQIEGENIIELLKEDGDFSIVAQQIPADGATYDSLLVTIYIHKGYTFWNFRMRKEQFGLFPDGMPKQGITYTKIRGKIRML